ncbi:MAG: hypothetical protein QOE44_238 [Solirubrobacteraceae bacterium]|nr:hypothetical protein [Solirubrobacteraceae bacterium]
MPATTRAQAAPATLGLVRPDPRGAAAFGLAFLLPTYLAFAGGGYDDVLRDEVGLGIWWVLLLGVAVGVLPLASWDRRCWIGLAAFGAFVVWSGLAITWSQSSERSVNELARLSMYAGILVLALATITPGARRQAVSGLAAGIGLVGLAALLSRLHPSWFPANLTVDFLPLARSRLAYPLNYWNGLAGLLALGVPATLAVADSARRLPVRALAAGSLPVTAAAVFLTGSRGGALAVGAGLAVYLALAPERLPKLATVANVGIGSAVMVASIAGRPSLDHNLGTALAHQEGSQLIVIGLLTCAGVGLVEVGIGLAARHARRPGWVAVSPRRALALAAVTAIAAAGVFAAAGGPGAASRQWESFKNPLLALPVAGQDSFQRFGAVSGNGRYQAWSSALDAAAAHPWGGIGPGTFEFWWESHGSLVVYLRNAHSLFFETAAEVGFVGLGLLVIALGLLVGRGVSRVRGADPERRLVLAAVVGGCVAFLVSAAVDWVWQLPAVVAAFLVLAAIALGPAGAGFPTGGRRGRGRLDPAGAGPDGARADARPAAGGLRGRGRLDPAGAGSVGAGADAGPAAGGLRGRRRLVLVGVAVAAIAAIGIPLVGTSELRKSQAQAAGAHLGPALARANAAGHVEPFAAGPPLQRALVLELAGRYADGAAAAAAATRSAPTDWRNWLVLSRLDAERGAPGPALAAFRRARTLNPHSLVFLR